MAWSAILSAYTYLTLNNMISYNDNTSILPLLRKFQSVGLDGRVLEYTPSYADTISACLTYIYLNVKQYTFKDDSMIFGPCTKTGLFLPFGSNQNTTQYTSDSLDLCLDAICAPATMNPDLAGIGASIVWRPQVAYD